MAKYCELGTLVSNVDSSMNIFLKKCLYDIELDMFVQNKRRRHLGAMSVISDKMLGESEQNLGKETQSLKRRDNFLRVNQWKGPLVLEAFT